MHRQLYGTGKPGSDLVACWPENVVRQEDEAFLEYLLGLETSNVGSAQETSRPAYGPQLIHVVGDLPPLFQSLMRQDQRIGEYWYGRGKTSGDCSRSGYDFALVRRLLILGLRDIDTLATVLATRPDGAVRQAGRDESYIRRTIANALMK